MNGLHSLPVRTTVSRMLNFAEQFCRILSRQRVIPTLVEQNENPPNDNITHWTVKEGATTQPVWKQSQLISFHYEILDAESDKPEALDNSLIEYYRNAFRYNWDHYQQPMTEGGYAQSTLFIYNRTYLIVKRI